MRNKFMENALPMVLILLVCSCPVFALPPDPDNAALLYYQAFCAYEKPDDTMQDMIRELANGRIEPKPTITKYIESCRPAIKLVESAGELTKCDWGMKYSDGLDGQAPYLAQSRTLTHIILADARTALKQADYDLAIQSCLTARKFGIDVGQNPITVGFLVEKSIERITNNCIQDILSSGAMELKTVRHLKAQLDKLDSRIKPLDFFLKIEQEVMAMYTTPDRIRELLPYVNPESTDRFVTSSDDTRDYILNADEQFCRRNLIYFNQYWDVLFSALKLPYQQAYNKLKELDKKTAEDSKENPDAFIAMLLGPSAWKIYNKGIQSRTFSNAVKTALEIYEIAARTGRLPDNLPEGLPKDLFSGEPFEYEKSSDGFILRCRGEDLVENKIHEYEFKVKK